MPINKTSIPEIKKIFQGWMFYVKDCYICNPIGMWRSSVACPAGREGRQSKNIINSHGMWRSSVACLHGVQEVAGSNPVIPTKMKKGCLQRRSFFALRLFQLGSVSRRGGKAASSNPVIPTKMKKGCLQRRSFFV